MPSVRNQLRRAKPQHKLVAIMVGLAFALCAVWLHEHRYFTIPVFAIMLTVLTTGAALIAPLVVTLRLSPKERKDNDIR